MSLSNIAERARPAPKLSEVLFEEPSRNFATVAALPSNVQAIEAALLFSTGLQTFLALVGPSGWGKSHVLEAVAWRIGQDTGLPPRIHSAIEWIQMGARADLPGALLLDNVQDAIEGSRNRLLLQIALERRVRSGRATLLSFTSSKVTRKIRSFLPSSRDWTIGFMPAPDPVERMVLIDTMALAEGLHISQTLVKMLATRMKGNGRTLAGALKRLRLSGAVWTDDRQILRACGALDPFFSDNSSWDLGERILRTAEEPEFQGRSVEPGDLVLHGMLRTAGLSEACVARTMGIPPAEAYSRAEKFAMRLAAGDDDARNLSNRFVERIVESLSLD